jgi:hypothetical protein
MEMAVVEIEPTAPVAETAVEAAPGLGTTIAPEVKVETRVDPFGTHARGDFVDPWGSGTAGRQPHRPGCCRPEHGVVVPYGAVVQGTLRVP